MSLETDSDSSSAIKPDEAKGAIVSRPSKRQIEKEQKRADHTSAEAKTHLDGLQEFYSQEVELVYTILHCSAIDVSGVFDAMYRPSSAAI